MICLICRRAELVDGLTSVSFEREKMKLLVIDVPARICPCCEEAYLEEDIVVRLLQTAWEKSEMAITETGFEYIVLY